jgi:hypothetical protein
MVVGRPSGTVGAEIEDALVGKIPDGINIKRGGMMEQQSSAFGSLGFAFIAAIVLIYLIMVILYNSLTDPLIVLFSIPLAMIGAFLALALTRHNLDIFSIIGLIVLIGLVAKNAILLVDFTNKIRKEDGLSTFNALIEAGKDRMRPILMTTFAMIFGMLPIALGSGDGAEMKNGSGTCVNYSWQTYYLCKGTGLECYLAWTPSKLYGHVANVVKVNGTWFVLDTQGQGFLLNNDCGFSEIIDIDESYVSGADLISSQRYDEIY